MIKCESCGRSYKLPKNPTKFELKECFDCRVQRREREDNAAALGQLAIENIWNRAFGHPYRTIDK